ncbi:hypothetical protein MD484_g9046, partial [Candolleomyces efflorescens]
MVSSDQDTVPVEPSLPVGETVKLELEAKERKADTMVAPVIDHVKPTTLKGENGEENVETVIEERNKVDGQGAELDEDVTHEDEDDEDFPQFDGGKARGKICHPVYGGIGTPRRPPRPGQPGPEEPIKEKKKPSWLPWNRTG